MYQHVKADDTLIKTVAGGGACEGQALKSVLYPSRAISNSLGEIFIADTEFNRIRKLTNGTKVTIAGTGSMGFEGDGLLAINAKLYGPSGLAFNSLGELIFSDSKNNRIRKILTNGTIITIAGSGKKTNSLGDNVPAVDAELKSPDGIFVTSNDEVIFADTAWNCIRKILQNGNIVTIAGLGYYGFQGDNGPALNSKLYYPSDVVMNANGDIFIADKNNHRIRKVLINGNIVTVAGSSSTTGYSGDNGLATLAKLGSPTGVALTSKGEIIIADSENHRIRKVNTNGNIVTIAGTGASGFSGDGGQATSANLFNPSGVFVNSNDEIIITDKGNNRIRKISTGGVITTVGGSGKICKASIKANDDVLITPGRALYYNHEIYIADRENHIIKKVTRSRNIVTIAGTGIAGFYGENVKATEAKLNGPYSIALNSVGELIIADTLNDRIRKVATNGTIITIAGTGSSGYNGDDILATTAKLNVPVGVCVTASDEIIFADYANYRVRKILNNGNIITIAGTGTPGYSGDNCCRLKF